MILREKTELLEEHSVKRRKERALAVESHGVLLTKTHFSLGTSMEPSHVVLEDHTRNASPLERVSTKRPPLPLRKRKKNKN